MATSGNGQHRRPRQAPKFVVTLGAAGAGLTLPLLTSGAAHAATASAWDRVAGCETGGQWSANGGDGFYGGLDLTQAVWEGYGGTAYATSPDLASRQQQIAVAEKILDAQGPGYWSGCGAVAGLVKGGPAPDVDPGTVPSGGGSAIDPGLLGGLLTPGTAPTPTPAPGATTGTPSPSPSHPASPGSGDSSPSATSGASSGSSTVPSAAPPAGAGSSGRHAGPAATEGERGEGSGTPRGSHARSAAPENDAAGTAPYTVRPGDNLDEIATKYALPGGWPALYDANRPVVGGDPDLIHPGQHLTLG